MHLCFSGNFGTLKAHGPFGGGQIGYNWQTGPFVLGVETDIQGSDISDNQTVTIIRICLLRVQSPSRRIANWTGLERSGVASEWRGIAVLIYATGGYAYGSLKYGLAMSETFDQASAANNLSFTPGRLRRRCGRRICFRAELVWQVRIPVPQSWLRYDHRTGI